ncbi:hypothetical protein TIFTF001_012596 [Ficus carica]|uniref:Uncharacterized protein n=1 Tax=Ficus carica TaxID=3494 RepID=A0AA88AG72_FICCA|nr:hypothetical protein TIFTF001_012596 [Ficus carica]
MTTKKDIGGNEHEVIIMFMELETTFKHVIQRLSDMKQYSTSGSASSDELEALKIVEKTTRENQEQAFRDLPNWRKVLREFMRLTWIEAAEKCRRKEHRSFIEWMVKFEQSEEHERRATFKVLRRVLIEIGVQISRSLIEYLLITRVSAERDEIATNLQEVESIIRCLKVEENLIVIDSFLSQEDRYQERDSLNEKEKDALSVLSSLADHRPYSNQDTKGRYHKRIKIKKDDMQIEKENDVLTLLTSLSEDTKGKHEKKTDKVKKDDSQIEKENDVLHLIIIEVLRLEVGFRYPDLPVMVSNEVFLAMGEHLVDNVFEDRLNNLSAKVDGLKLSVGENDSMRKFVEQVLNVGLKEIWYKLNL